MDSPSPLWAFRDYDTSAPFVCFGERVYWLEGAAWQMTSAKDFHRNPARFKTVSATELPAIVVAAVDGIVESANEREARLSNRLSRQSARIERLEAALREAGELFRQAGNLSICTITRPDDMTKLLEHGARVAKAALEAE